MVVEQTQMSPEFNVASQRYDEYVELTESLVDRLEGAVQHNPNILQKMVMEAPPSEDPHEKLADSLSAMLERMPPANKATLGPLVAECRNAAKLHRQTQLDERRSIRHLRRFIPEEYKQLKEQRTKLYNIRDHMDEIKHKVKNAKSTVQIEKLAILYQQAVAEFDQQATKVLQLLDQLPSIKEMHQRDLTEYFDVMLKYHESMLTVISGRTA
ncbi:Protein F36A2.11 [Aphelenchoides avenae]|nr:Protein F36A2.11 [Aphelenchus avenae]